MIFYIFNIIFNIYILNIKKIMNFIDLFYILFLFNYITGLIFILSLIFIVIKLVYLFLSFWFNNSSILIKKNKIVLIISYSQSRL